MISLQCYNKQRSSDEFFVYLLYKLLRKFGSRWPHIGKIQYGCFIFMRTLMKVEVESHDVDDVSVCHGVHPKVITEQ